MAKYKVENELGCGFMGGIFQLRSYRLRKSTVHSLPAKAANNVVNDQSKYNSKMPPIHESESLRNTTSEAAVLDFHKQNIDQKPARKSTSDLPRPSNSHQKPQNRRLSDAARSSTSSSGNSSQTKKLLQNPDSKIQREANGNSLELARIKTGHPQSNESKAIVRATSGNVMLSGHLGNLRNTGNLLGTNSPNSSAKTLGYHNRNLQEISPTGKKGVMGNIVRKNSDELGLYRSPRNKVDPEVLKSIGNEAYKQGRFEEALALYDRAIALDSNQATYHCNKSASLIGLGRLMEAILECEAAIRLDPSYLRAHQRLATLYIKLGEAEKALDQCNYIGACPDSKIIFQAQEIQNHLKNCREARTANKWNTMFKETQCAISVGADSAPQVYALQSEALLKLLRHQEAYATYLKIPNFAFDSCTKFFGLAGSSYLLMIGAQVYLTAGRFEDAVAAAQEAARLDPSNKEVSAMVKRARAVVSARMSGNLLFTASKFKEACAVYSEGLEHDPYNSVLLCNRAACRFKLGQFEKAVEDCTAALDVQPSYSKARLRRADCNSKLERWEPSIQDYEMLLREKPGDEEVARALFEAQLQLKKQHGEDIKDLKFGSNLVFISSNDCFRHYVTSPGMSVVLFCNKATHKQVLLVLEQICKRFPSVNFLKVEIEDRPYLAKSEGVNSIPVFKIYKNGSRVKEIPGNNRELLERSVQLYSS
ncbi:TPR repeat-containing thioredoxin like [Quillaja saponaria]|uniref:TPR repeat-containing thioredoxin like n=1 Tax=Quillaja saponaria TaxID=32244 RepID=A0AAD7LJ00_QUISA|nr:TPR repeat-containing thioredoxin like [Quillaja saponaria]